MTLTKDEILARRKRMGASDIPAILGLSPFRTPYDVWLEKTGQLPDQAESEAAHAGSRFEAAVLDEAEQRLGPLVRCVEVPAPDKLPIVATLDARLQDGGLPVEAKTAGLFAPLSDAWGEEDTDQIPDAYIVQVQVQMFCTATELAHVAAFLGGRGFAFFRVERNQALLNAIIARSMAFWTGCVEANTPPADAAPTYDVIRRAARIPETTATVRGELIAAAQAAIEARKAAEATEEQAKAALLAAMGTAEAAVSVDGLGCTFLEQSRTTLPAAPIKANHPEIFAKYAQSTTYRVLRFLKPKKGRVQL
jgi:putative phage-type endonuclease